MSLETVSLWAKYLEALGFTVAVSGRRIEVRGVFANPDWDVWYVWPVAKFNEDDYMFARQMTKTRGKRWVLAVGEPGLPVLPGKPEMADTDTDNPFTVFTDPTETGRGVLVPTNPNLRPEAVAYSAFTEDQDGDIDFWTCYIEGDAPQTDKTTVRRYTAFSPIVGPFPNFYMGKGRTYSGPRIKAALSALNTPSRT